MNDNIADKSKKIKIGYLVADWNDGSCAFWRRSLFLYFNAERVEVYAYVTAGRVRSFAPVAGAALWRDIAGKRVDTALGIIRHDKLDILVDATGIKKRFVLEILRRKPAKVQAAFIDYFNTTDLDTVDYLITDRYCDPVNQKGDYFKEALCRLPNSHYCHVAPAAFHPLQPAPFKENGYITFGCFYNFLRLTDEIFLLWREILTAVPRSRLILRDVIFSSNYGSGEMWYRLRRLKMPLDRIELRPASKDGDYADYTDVDIMLDTTPYQGGSSTCDALYMGVPVIVFVGKRHSTRFGYAFIKHLGMEECLAFSSDDYVKKTVQLANNKTRLTYFRKSLREKLGQPSGLMDYRRYSANLERAYQLMLDKVVENREIQQKQDNLQELMNGVFEALDVIYQRLKNGDDSEIVGQLLGEVVDSFVNVRNILQQSRYYSSEFRHCEELCDSVAAVEKLYRRSEYERICGLIEDDIVPNMKIFRKNLILNSSRDIKV